MPERGVLLVAATERELCGRSGLACGVGPVEAAAATARGLALERPRAVLHVGIAGGRGLAPGAVALGSEAVYVDLAASFPIVTRVAAAPALLEAARGTLPAAAVCAIGTSARVGGVADELTVEAMEGFGVLRACALDGVPALEVRAISNAIGEDDRSRWDVDGALRALDAAVAALLPALTAVAESAPGPR
ncbi:MAG: futalosine hydrolase [Gaiella sp.]